MDTPIFLPIPLTKVFKNDNGCCCFIMKSFIFVPVKAAHSHECFTIGNAIDTIRTHREENGSFESRWVLSFVWHADRAKLWVNHSLGQVNSVLDKCKPHGQEFVFDGGTFSFVSFFVTVLTRLFFPLFSFE